jgi:hypothetical protein
VVTSQESAAVRWDLEADGMHIGRHLNLILKHRDKPDVNAELFEDYLRSVFLPHLMIARIVKDPREEDAMLLMDNWSPHITSPRCHRSSLDCPCARASFRTPCHANLPSSRFDHVSRSEKTQ